MPTLGPNTRGALLALAAFAVYASHDAAIKVLGGGMSPVQIVFFSVLIGTPMAALMVWRAGGLVALRPANPGWLALRSAGVVVSALAGFHAFSVLPLAQVYALLFAAPLLITLMAIPMLGEKVGPRRFLAVIVGLGGVLIVLRPGQAELGIGHLAAVLAACGSALSQIVVRRIGDTETGAALLVWPMLGNIAIMGAMMPFVHVPMSPAEWVLMTYVAVCAFVAMLLIIAAYRTGEAVVVAPMQYSQILWAVLFGLLFFDEVPDAATALGAAVVMASGLYIVLREGSGAASRQTPVLAAQPRPDISALPQPTTPGDGAV